MSYNTRLPITSAVFHCPPLNSHHHHALYHFCVINPNYWEFCPSRILPYFPLWSYPPDCYDYLSTCGANKPSLLTRWQTSTKCPAWQMAAVAMGGGSQPWSCTNAKIETKTNTITETKTVQTLQQRQIIANWMEDVFLEILYHFDYCLLNFLTS